MISPYHFVELDGFAVRRIALRRECVHQGISWGKARHCVDGCSEVRWVGICSGARSGIPRSEDLRCEDPRSEDPRSEDPRSEDLRT